jgi:hypothetical protein
VDLRTNSDYFPIQHQLVVISNAAVAVHCAVRTELLRTIHINFKLPVFNATRRADISNEAPAGMNHSDTQAALTVSLLLLCAGEQRHTAAACTQQTATETD